MTMIGSPACPLGRLEGQARGGGEGEGRCRLSSPPPKGATPCDRPSRGAILIPRPLGVVDYSGAMSNLLALPFSQGLTTEAASVSRAALDLRRGILIQVKPEIFEPLTIPRPGQTSRRRSLRNGRSIWCRDRSIGGL